VRRLREDTRLTFGLNVSVHFMKTAGSTRFFNFAVDEFPYCGSSRPFITEYWASLEASLHRED